MCILAIGVEISSQYPLLVVANRDEYYDRPARPPALWPGSPRVLAGRDLRSGGTWLGINEHRVVAAVTNRHTEEVETAGRPSRGLLCKEALRGEDAEEGLARVQDVLSGADYNPFNLMIADPQSCLAVTNHPAFKFHRCEAGWHVVANSRLDDENDPRVVRTKALLPASLGGEPGQTLRVLGQICSDHGDDRANALCVHGEHAGTRSASVVVVDAAANIFFHHANGPPCRTAFKTVRIPFT